MKLLKLSFFFSFFSVPRFLSEDSSCPFTRREDMWGVEVELPLTWTLNGGELSASRPVSLSPRILSPCKRINFLSQIGVNNLVATTVRGAVQISEECLQ